MADKKFEKVYVVTCELVTRFDTTTIGLWVCSTKAKAKKLITEDLKSLPAGEFTEPLTGAADYKMAILCGNSVKYVYSIYAKTVDVKSEE